MLGATKHHALRSIAKLVSEPGSDAPIVFEVAGRSAARRDD